MNSHPGPHSRAPLVAGPRIVATALCVLALGCSAGSGSPHNRLVAVHNALAALGMGMVGHVSEGSLGENNSVRIPVQVDAACYTFVAFGGGGVRDIDLTITDASNQRVAGDTSHDQQATVQHCFAARGAYTVAVRMAAGSGTYALSSWRGGAGGAATPGAAVAAGGGATGSTCSNPIAIQIGQTVTGDTSHSANNQTGSCHGEGEAPENVYSLQIERRQQITVSAEQDYDGALYIRSGCDDERSELACNDDQDDTRHSRVVAVLDPGTYYVFADGFADNRGNYTFTVTAADVPSPQDVCQNATALTLGHPISGSTANDVNVFQATCAQGARGPDRVYRFEVPQESRVQVAQESDYDGVLYMRRACADPTSEVACNDDVEDTQHSRINSIVPPGTYYLFSDGFTPTGSGNFTLEVNAVPVAGGGAPGDTCADAQAITAGASVEGDTLRARDDVQPPCAVQQDGYDVVYRLDVQNRSRVRLWFEHADIGQNAVIWLARACNASQANASIACRAGAVTEEHAIDQVVDRGQYYVVVDSTTARAFGRFRLRAQVEDVAALERACRAARPLTNHQTVTGTTAGDDHFQASCAGHTRSAENLYRIVLRRRSFVRLALTTTTHDGALYIRRDCTNATSEVACNDDAPDTRHSLVESTLDPGTYTVFVDGFAQGQNGAYSLEATITPQ